MPKFSIKDLLLGATLVAVGLGIVVIGFDYAPPHLVRRGAMQAYFLGTGGILAGGGVAYPFGKGQTSFLLMCGVIAMLIVVLVFNSLNSLP